MKIKNILKKYILPCLITLFLLAICLEVYARYRDKHESGRHVEILYKEKFDQVKQVLSDRQEVKRQGRKRRSGYYDYYIFSPGQSSSKTINYVSYYPSRSNVSASRNVPGSYPIGKGDITIWLFGGSTMQNAETIDELTIANQLAVNLKKSGIKATVVNFGMGAFQSTLESIKFQELLRKVNKKERPDGVIFYDGFNDAGTAFVFEAGSLQEDLSKKMEALVNGYHGKLLIYSLSNLLGKISHYWRDRLSYKFSTKILFGQDLIKNNSENLLKAVDIYESNTRMVRGICKEFDIKPFFILQPMLFTKAKLTEFEQKFITKSNIGTIKFMKKFYEMVRERMKNNDDFYDLSDIFNDSQRNDFFDLGHIGPYTGIKIGEKIFEIVNKKVD
ncbi:SGNH/GDSL hydrolase family protein [Thermodesulfobacteriota bacterium]